MILVKNCELFAPEAQGRRDVLIGGGGFCAIAERIVPGALPSLTELDGAALRMVPGLIDPNVHLTGGGGEGGPATQTSPPTFSDLLEGGITTAIGCLGTDGYTRPVMDLLMKAKALRERGLSCWMHTGSYQVPPPTISGDVARDIILFDEIIGVGEVAVADHRSSAPTLEELTKLALAARVGGMLGGKCGVVFLHMGDGRQPFDLVKRVVDTSELRATQFLPTHCTRNPHIFEEAKQWGQEGYVDLTASSFPFFPDEELKPSRAVVELLAAGVPLEHITVSSDSGASLPSFDSKGRLLKLTTGKAKSVFDELRDLVEQEQLPLSDALKVFTSNAADILKLERKGRISPHHDADAVLLDDEFRIVHVIAKGRLLVKDGVHQHSSSGHA